MNGAAVGRPLRQSDPTELGPYTLLRRIGEGGMGSVYLAQKQDGGRLVALKVIRRDLATDTDFRRRFRGEVARAKQVPAFCTAEVLDADPDHEPPYLVVEFVNGPSLARVVQGQGPLSEANLHGLAIGVATALTAIHGAGVIHRDLKPANVLLALGSPKVIDFGIAKAAENTATDSSPNMLMGTIPYMAPERLDPAGSKPLTKAADIFAWGAIVAYAGTGRPPFGNDSVDSVARILTQEPDLTGLADSGLRDLVLRALAKQPERRPTARELLDQLIGPRPSEDRLIQAGSEQAVVSVGATADTTRLAVAPARVRRRRLIPALLATAVVVLAAVVVGFLTGVIRPPQLVAGSHPGPSASPSAIPAPSLTAPASASPRPPVVRDKLVAAGPLFESNDQTHRGLGKCKLDGALIAQVWKKETFRCPSYLNPFTDFRMEVEISLSTADSCAGIWFRDHSYQGYLLTICNDKYMLATHDDDGLNYFRTLPVIAPAKAKTSFTAAIEVRGNEMTVFHNGQSLGTAIHNTYISGKILMGIAIPGAPEPARSQPYEVLFRNLLIWDLSSTQS